MFNPSVRQDVLLGYNGGISFRYAAERNFGLQIELNYSQRGWKERDNLYARRLDYIELPFLAHIASKGKRVSVFFTIGPKASFLLNEEVLYNNTDDSISERHIRPIANHFDYGVIGGGGIQFATGKQYFSFEARANYSLNTTFPNNKRHFYSFSNNMNLALNLAWMMRVNK
jgi:hypothetical protein